MRVAMGFTMVFTGSMFVVMVMVMVVRVVVTVPMLMLVGLSTNACGLFARQSASAIFTHYSISNEATSISRPARNSLLA